MLKIIKNKFYEFTTKNSYNKITTWDNNRQFIWTTTKNFLNQKIKKNQVQNLLDIGCGGGRNLEYSKKIGFEKTNLYGIDYSKTQINTIKKKGFFGEVGKIQNLTKYYKKDFFDLIICEASFHHILNKKERENSLKEMKKIMKKKGIGLISIWNPEKEFLEKNLKTNKFKFVDKENKICKITYTDLNQNKKFNRFYYFFEKQEILNLIKKEFKIINSNQDKGNFYIEFEKT
jgi:SAM-dependent methyltransferase